MLNLKNKNKLLEPTGSNQENFSTHDYISSTSKEQEAPYESMFEPSANFQHTSVPANDPIQPNTEENPIMKELLDENSDRNENLQESVINDISMPKKDGSPAFKIVASKVYILYPSMFQDPNIFGRFSIPQNVNMEGLGGSGEKREEITSKPVDEVLVDKGSTHEIAQEEVVVQTQRDNPVPINPALHGNPIHQQAIRPQPYQNQMYGYGQQRQMPNMYPNSYRRSGNKSTNNGRESTESGVERNWSSKGVSRRSMAKQEDESNATGGTTENKEEEEEEKKPVETHLNGHIVVQNQDVNEYNVKHSY